MIEPSQNNEKKLFNLEQPLDETGQSKPQKEKEPESHECPSCGHKWEE